MAADNRRREKKINLAALRKLDQFACNILDTASSVAHYNFDAVQEKWEKTEFEGSLFVYNRNENRTEVAFLIMNRLKKENFKVTVNSGMEFKTQDPFLLCRTSDEIIGIWFYNQIECARISALLSRIAELADDETQLKQEIDEALDEIDQREAPKVDVLKMFAKAKQEYDKKQSHNEKISKSASVPKFVPSEQKRPIILKRTNSVPDGMHEEITEEDEDRGITMHASGKSQDSETLMKILQRPKNQERKSRARTLSYGESVVSETSKDFKDHIKRLSGTKAGDLALVEDIRLKNLPRPQAIDVAKLEATVLLNQAPDEWTEEQQSEVKKEERKREQPESVISSQVVPKVTNRVAITTTTLLSPANITPTKPTISKSGLTGKGRCKGLAAALNLSDLKSGEKGTTGSVMSVGSKLKSVGDSQRTARREPGFAMKFPDPPVTGTATSLMSPMKFTTSAKMTAPQDTSSTSELSQLDKQQFRDAFINLLQTDDAFVEKLHSSYLNMKLKS